MELIIIPIRSGLKVTYRNLSSRIPSGTVFEWDFGDGTDIVTGLSPEHTYQQPGIYLTTVTAKPNTGDNQTLEVSVLVTDIAKTSLSDTIYRLIDNYLPTNIIDTFPFEKKRLLIEKWQLYIQPLVEREIPEDQFNNEMWYEALENQLVMEAAVLDYLTNTFMNLLQSKSTTEVTIDEENPEGGGDGVKKIVTGPSEVEFFNPLETDKDILASIIRAMQPGGFIETLRLNLCTLADRLTIILPFCEQRNTISVVPKVVNRRTPVKYQGPNPGYPVKK